MGLKNWFVRRKLKQMNKKLSNDKKTTLLGAILAALIALNVDYGKVLEGDLTEIGKVLAVVITATLSYFINKPEKSDGGQVDPKGN